MHLERHDPGPLVRIQLWTNRLTRRTGLRASTHRIRASEAYRKSRAGKAKVARMRRRSPWRPPAIVGAELDRSRSPVATETRAGMDFPDRGAYAIIFVASCGKAIRSLITLDNDAHGSDRAGESIRAFAAEPDSAGESPRRRGGRGRCAARHHRDGPGLGRRLRGGHPLRRDRRGQGGCRRPSARHGPARRRAPGIADPGIRPGQLARANSLPKSAGERRWS